MIKHGRLLDMKSRCKFSTPAIRSIMSCARGSKNTPHEVYLKDLTGLREDLRGCVHGTSDAGVKEERGRAAGISLVGVWMGV